MNNVITQGCRITHFGHTIDGHKKKIRVKNTEPLRILHDNTGDRHRVSVRTARFIGNTGARQRRGLWRCVLIGRAERLEEETKYRYHNNIRYAYDLYNGVFQPEVREKKRKKKNIYITQGLKSPGPNA